MRSRAWWGIGSVLLLSGCTLGPDPQRPPTVADAAAGYVHAPEDWPEDARLDAERVSPWWRTFGDPVTAQLVEAALEANTDLQAAAARVLQADAALRQAGARRWPEASVSAGISRTKNSFVLPQTGRVSTYSTTYSDSLSVAWQADLFGGLRRGQQAALAELRAQEASRQALAHTVVAQVVRARVQLSTLERSAELARAIRDSWQGTLRTTDGRYERGLVPALDLRQARENLAASEAAVVAAERRLEQARLPLDVLLGRRPGTSDVPAAGLPDLPALEPVPLGLPAELLERRPDLEAAEMRLAAATARIGVALADLFPGLTLNASAGNNADRVSQLLSSETLIYNAAASLVQAVFDGGRRRAGVAIARAVADEAAAVYAGTVLTALQEVEDALVREQSLRRQLELLDQRLEEARAADRLARERYLRGVEGLLRVLETERRLRTAQEQLISARADLWNARIDLHLALGGDWGPVSESSTL